MGKTLYLECYSGISGDMTVGALLDLGAREEALREALEALPLNGYEITIGRTKKCGIDACDFDVILRGGRRTGAFASPWWRRLIRMTMSTVQEIILMAGTV